MLQGATNRGILESEFADALLIRSATPVLPFRSSVQKMDGPRKLITYVMQRTGLGSGAGK